MQYAYITGTGSGIGRALAQQMLNQNDTKVIGISRTKSIDHANYLHISLDLSRIGSIQKFRFEKLPSPHKIILVNNAGTLGDVGYVGNMNDNLMIRAYNVNLVAPTVFMNRFMRFYRNVETEKIIINISSGAGSKEVDGWSVYCSSKAALNMATKTAVLEQKKLNSKGSYKIFAIAPGNVDTPMQEEIRQSDIKDFSRVQDFHDYKENNELADPEITAKKLISIINDPGKFKDPIFRISY